MRELHPNAHFSIRDNFESHSNVTDVSDLEPRKEARERISREDGIQTREISDVAETSDETCRIPRITAIRREAAKRVPETFI
jgi:hypothetical protein